MYAEKAMIDPKEVIVTPGKKPFSPSFRKIYLAIYSSSYLVQGSARLCSLTGYEA